MYDHDEIEEALGEVRRKADEIEVFGDAEVADAIGMLLRIIGQLNEALNGMRLGLESVQEQEGRSTAAAMSVLLDRGMARVS